MRRAAVVASVGALLVVLVAGGLTLLGMQAKQQPDHSQFCFAEWCIAPKALTLAGSSAVVHVEVASQAKSATQRPDHPQAWLVDSEGRMAGGPQAALSAPVAPGGTYSADLAFPQPVDRCSTFLVSEGGWPPFLGLGYAPSPFTERASWQLCA